MKKFSFLLLAVSFFASGLNAQSLKEGRVVLSYVNATVDDEMIDQWDNDKLTPKEEKMHVKWTERLIRRLQTRMVETSDVVMTDLGIDLQPLETVLKVQNKMQNELSTVYEEGEYFPNLLFPKKVLKKNGEKADVGEYFVSMALNFSKPTKPSMKGYKPLIELSVKVFNKSGERIKKIKKELEGPFNMFHISLKDPYKLDFNKIDDASIDWIFDEFGLVFDQAVKEAIDELL